MHTWKNFELELIKFDFREHMAQGVHTNVELFINPDPYQKTHYNGGKGEKGKRR
jgi:hypothetical protein